MNTLYIILTFLLYHGINILIAWINSEIVVHRIANGDPNQIDHSLWAIIYLILVAPIYFLFHSFWLIGSVILLHLSIFPIAYNLFRSVPPFNLSRTSKAITDRFMVWLGLRDTELVNLSAEVIAIFLMVISIKL